MQPGLTDQDIDRISSRLGLSPEAFITAHLEIDPHRGRLPDEHGPVPVPG
jgi:hypothetical protein